MTDLDEYEALSKALEVATAAATARNGWVTAHVEAAKKREEALFAAAYAEADRNRAELVRLEAEGRALVEAQNVAAAACNQKIAEIILGLKAK